MKTKEEPVKEKPVEVLAWELPRIEVGEKVKVVKREWGDQMNPDLYKQEGVVVALDFNHGCGEIHEGNIGCIDPMYVVGFVIDGKPVQDGFFREELEVVNG